MVPFSLPTIVYASEKRSVVADTFSNTAQPPDENSLIRIKSPTSTVTVGTLTMV